MIIDDVAVVYVTVAMVVAMLAIWLVVWYNADILRKLEYTDMPKMVCLSLACGIAWPIALPLMTLSWLCLLGIKEYKSSEAHSGRL